MSNLASPISPPNDKSADKRDETEMTIKPKGNAELFEGKCTNQETDGSLSFLTPSEVESIDENLKDSEDSQTVYKYLIWPPQGKLGEGCTLLLITVLFWLTLYTILLNDALPGGNIFSLFIIFVMALIGGRLVELVKLPGLLGMLVMGILFRSIPGLKSVGQSIDSDWSSALRNLALVIILLRAGLGLDPSALKKLSFTVVRLAFSPCLVETIVTAILTHLFLGFPWIWGFMLGFVLSAVTPAVIVPCLLSISEKGYGVEKGIPTLVIAAASIDDVLAISGFTVLLGITFSSGSLLQQVLQGPLDVLIGTIYGVVLGFLTWVLPNNAGKYVAPFRFCILLFGGIVSLFGSAIINFGGAGALGVLIMSFVAGLGWRKQGWTDQNPVSDYFNYSWFIMEPFLFALIGTEIQIDALDPSTVGWGLLTILIGSICRMVTSFLVVMGANLNLKERLFIAIAWLPKATVQAAIGSTALDLTYKSAKDKPFYDEYVTLGKQVLTIAVLVILISAPLGAAGIVLSAPKLLTKDSLEEKKEETTNV